MLIRGLKTGLKMTAKRQRRMSGKYVRLQDDRAPTTVHSMGTYMAFFWSLFLSVPLSVSFIFVKDINAFVKVRHVSFTVGKSTEYALRQRMDPSMQRDSSVRLMITP
jgi:hypothetical protein